LDLRGSQDVYVLGFFILGNYEGDDSQGWKIVKFTNRGQGENRRAIEPANAP